MIIKELSIKGLLEIRPKVWEDNRGYFFEFYNQQNFKTQGLEMNFVQDNHSFSHRGVIRGLHFQKAPFAQGKMVRVLKGSILDVAVDVRKSSPTFGKHIALVLDDKQHNMIYIPEGFAHGFAALEDSIVNYKCTQLYHKASEGGIRWDDPELAIDWQVAKPIVSEKDQEFKFLSELVKLEEF